MSSCGQYNVKQIHDKETLDPYIQRLYFRWSRYKNAQTQMKKYSDKIRDINPPVAASTR